MELSLQLLRENGGAIKLDSQCDVGAAPVPPQLLRRVRAVIANDGEVHTPYGATEALPIACTTATVVLQHTAAQTAVGMGTCVGKHFPNIRWRVIRIVDEPIRDIQNTRDVPLGEIGELIVQGPVVTDHYATRTDANALHKIADGSGFWHRMGDVGYLDVEDRFWFCGRKSQRVQTAHGVMFTIPCEAIFNEHAAIYRSALVGVGPPPKTPAIVVEPRPESYPQSRRQKSQLLDELHARARSNDLTRTIEHILIRRRLPVDIRHNAKIFREQLAVWATKKIKNR